MQEPEDNSYLWYGAGQQVGEHPVLGDAAQGDSV